MNAEYIKKKAKELGASVCGIGDVSLFKGDNPQHNPYSILPNAKCIIGFGLKIPRGLYDTMERKTQYYNYTNLGVKYTDEIFADIFLFKCCRYRTCNTCFRPNTELLCGMFLL